MANDLFFSWGHQTEITIAVLLVDKPTTLTQLTQPNQA
jgi:hypothetical protein